MIYFKVVDRVVLEEDNQHALVHTVANEQVKELLKRLEYITTILGSSPHKLRLRGLRV